MNKEVNTFLTKLEFNKDNFFPNTIFFNEFFGTLNFSNVSLRRNVRLATNWS